MTLRILYVGMLPPHPGGSAISASQLLRGFARRGHCVRALAPITPADLQGGDHFADRNPELAITRYLMPHTISFAYRPAPNSFHYLKEEAEKVRQVLTSSTGAHRPDLLFLGREIFAAHVAGFAASQGLPCVLRAAGGTTFGMLAGNYPPQYVKFLLQQLGKVDRIITVARHMEVSCRAWGLQRSQTILNAIDLEQFTPRCPEPALLKRLRIGGQDQVVLYVGDLHSRKQPLDLVAAAAKALNINARLLFVVVGDGPLRLEMEALCRAKNLLDRFRFVGWADYETVPDYVNLADIVVMLSEGEGLARVYLEAQACGKLLLTSDIPPAREVVQDGETGLLFRLRDIDDLTAKILGAMADSELRLRIGAQARQRVQFHSLDQAVESYLEVFHEVMHARKAPAATVH